MKRRFIRLDEIEQKTSYTQGDILDFVEQGLFPLCARITERHMSALHVVEGKDAVSMVFSYDGMVALSKDVSRAFTRTNQKQIVKRVLVLEPNKIQHWKSPESVFGEITNTRLKMVSNVAIPQKPFVALTKVLMGQSLKQVGSNFIATLMSLSDKEPPEGMPREVDNTLYFQASNIVIKPEDLRLDLHELSTVLGSNDTEKPTCQNVIEVCSDEVVTHPIEQIVYRILRSDRNLRTDKIWRLLRLDVNREGKRKYDIDSVIDEMTADDISWFGRGVDSTLTMSYDSFRRGLVARVRKAVKAE